MYFVRHAYQADPDNWKNEGTKWQGGTLKGLESKLGYSQRLGVVAIWIRPVFKQVVNKHLKTNDGSYHGYAIQNFLDVDPHFDTRQDFVWRQLSWPADVNIFGQYRPVEGWYFWLSSNYRRWA
ncbi:alpha-amylase family glycosyl hydrolase [Methylicorpusculum sp.]|uniref:alpha-amylase family glycosyl hydrolase n=1 Tax=Methylicorpusculum sp. TaxID=2713644 RepID=UPI0035228891